VMRQLLALQW